MTAPEASPTALERPDEREWLARSLAPGYQLVRLLGRGANGAVYLALDVALQRYVAVKALLLEHLGDDARRRQFRREALANARLAHPSIVPIHAFVETGDVVASVMRYVRGPSLAYVLWRRVPLPVPEACRILADLANALAYAHRHRIVHRDIKPENVLIDNDSGRAMLTDFGIARSVSLDAMRIDELRAERGVVQGTVHFMSPEQAAGEPDLDGRSDLYSLGVLGYALLSGTLPFEGRALREVIAAHGSILPPSLAERAPHLSPETVHTIMRCLAAAPEDRWPDGDALADALRREGLHPRALRVRRLRSRVGRVIGRIVGE
jgi:serine/threonine-protein kinase